MSDLQVASRMNEAAAGFMEAAELFARAVGLLAEIEAMKAENAQRAHLGQSMAWTDAAFQEALDAYKLRVKP